MNKLKILLRLLGFPGCSVGIHLQCRRCRRCRFEPWVRKIPGLERVHGNTPQYSFSFLNLFLLEGNCFTILWWVLPYIHMNQPWVYICSLSWTSLPPPSPTHPSGSSQWTSPEHPVSCIKPGLVIYFTYDNLHVSMLFSQIIPPLPPPTESKSLFFTSVSLLLSCI